MDVREDWVTRQELKSQVLRRLFVGKKPSEQQRATVSEAIDQVLAPYEERDRKAIERNQAPYNFDGKAVASVERAVRMRTKI